MSAADAWIRVRLPKGHESETLEIIEGVTETLDKIVHAFDHRAEAEYLSDDEAGSFFGGVS